MTRLVTASSARRWLACSLSAWLPQEESLPGPAAQAGNKFHKLVEGPIVAKQWVPIDPLDSGYEIPVRNALGWLNPELADATEVLAEQAYDLAPLGGYAKVEGQREPHWRDSMLCERLTLKGHREYPAQAGHVYGTADVVVLGKNSAHVIDWKTGKKSDDHEAQLLTLALMVAEAEKVSTVKATAVYVSLQSGKVTPVTWLFDSFDLHMHAGQVVRTCRELIGSKTPEPNPGKHCFYCPAIGCPEKLRPSR